MKVAIIQDWLTDFGGAEKVLLEIYDLFPNAHIYTAVYNKKKMGKYFKNADIRTSFIQKLPFGVKHYRKYLPLMPMAFEEFDLSEYDLVISLSSCCAKGVNVNANSLHICYCHTPMRYAWDMYNKYNTGNIFKRIFVAKQLHKIRQWDRISADRVDYFIANSNYVANRINKHYRREAEVIYPPISKKFYEEKIEDTNSCEDFYLVATRLVDYKKVDVIIETFNELGIPLRIVGTGPEERKLKKMAKDNIEFVGFLNQEKLIEQYKRCKAFVFMAEEDFGMVMAEAQAMGKPVIAYKKGGASEIIQNDVTGILVEEQNKESLKEAVLSMEKKSNQFEPEMIRKRAEKFKEDNFQDEINKFIQKKLAFIPKIGYNSKGRQK